MTLLFIFGHDVVHKYSVNVGDLDFSHRFSSRLDHFIISSTKRRP